ncbi:alpha/beta fold hydrolase [Planobispora takensis]|uniref:3-oxoadipate enol-lactonase n=1 Tax=Planobispora takensis TaxID=1367882 RepID=A0A8J3SVQ6_9ACTN|nr:alpha/beta fold hydrolase [Planobispora takensis]GIH99966.1 3-oxoadipate enol-lactonase [Planobispora takensis]
MTQIPGFPELSTTVVGSGPGILLAHGASGSIADNYGTLVPVLAEGHTVVGPDYPGSGATPRAAGGLTLDELADALVASAVGAGVETFTVIGFSLGTTVAVRAAARHPERVRGLVLAAGFAKADNQIELSLGLWEHLLRSGDAEGFARIRAVNGFSVEFLNGLPAELLAQLLDLGPAGLPLGVIEQAALGRAADTREDLAGITVPTLVVAPTRDILVDPVNSRYLAEHIPGARYAELDSGHVVMAERPAEWQELIEKFLSEHGL